MLIRLAGIVAIEHDDSPPRHLSSAQAQVAFARLTLERASGTSRDQLADTVWPERLPDTWASALRSVVTRVRAFVAGTLPLAGSPLVARGGLYLLRLPAEAGVDIECAEDTLSEAMEAFSAGAFVDAQRLATTAVSCLQGPFLPHHDGEWVNGVRERVEELRISGLETASLAASALRDERNASRFADEAVMRAPLRESAHRCRMAAHAAAGNRAEALRSYHRLQRILAEELGIDPAPETQAAYLDLLGGGVTSSSLPQGPSQPRPSSAAPFVGRRTESATLADAWSRAEQGASHIVLVTGESGIGKTRLVTEAARQISLTGGLMMYGRCDGGSSVPYQPFVEAVGGFLTATPDDSMPDLGDATRETLAALICEPAQWPGEVTSSKRTEVLSALTDLLVRVARDQPVAVVLDDIDLAHDDTLILLRRLFQRGSGTSLLIIATAKHPDQLTTAVRDLDREGRLCHLALRGLEEPDVGALVHQVLHENGAALSPRRLLAETAGNAYLLLELLRWHRDQDAEHMVPGMPPGIHEYVRARLAALDPAPRQLLRAAAVAGKCFELDLVARAAELEVSQAMDARDMLVADGLVAEVDTGTFGQEQASAYCFTHDVLRQVLYEQLGKARRRWLHTRLADAIEFRRAGEMTRYNRILSHHRAAGAAPQGDRRAVQWAWRAAARALEKGAPHEAVRLHRQALDRVPAEDHELRAEALTNLGLAQLAVRHAECGRTLLDGAMQALHSGRLNIAAQAALGLADAVATRPRLRSKAAALIDLVMRTAPNHATGRRGHGTLGGIDDLTLGRLLARQTRLGTRVAAGTTATMALNALARELRLLEGPDYAERRLTLAEEMLSVATATNDTNAQVVAAHHRVIAAQVAGAYPADQNALTWAAG